MGGDGDDEVASAVAVKLKSYLDLHKGEEAFGFTEEFNDELEVYFNNYQNSKQYGEQIKKAKTIINELRNMQSMTQLTEKEIATKKKLEIQMARHNNPFILSPYAIPMSGGAGDDSSKRMQNKFIKKRVPKKRILSASRVQSAIASPSSAKSRPETSKTTTPSEREQILNLTAKLLVATETVALPKNRHQSRESQTSTERRVRRYFKSKGQKLLEYFPSILSASHLHAARAKSSYSDPGVHTLTKERVEKLNSPSQSHTGLNTELRSVDSGSLKSLNGPFHVETGPQGYVVRKKPASYPSSLTSQNSRLSPRVPALTDNFTVIKDKTDDLESLDDDYFDNELTRHNRALSNTEWFEGTREKQLADTSTQTIQNRGTQTSKPKDDSFDDYQPTGGVGTSTNTSPPQKHTTIGTQLSFDEPGNEGGTQTQTYTNNTHSNFSIQTQTNFDPKVITYQIYVITGDVASSSTNADVKINIFGERGDSGDRPLLKSKSSTVPFQRGQIDSFDIDCKFLGKLTNIRVGHNGTSADDGWFLEKVHIRPGQNSTKAYTFICNKWLSAREGDGQIMRDVIVSEETPVSELPPILPRKALRCRETDEETVMSEARPKVLLSKATRDKLNNNESYSNEKDYSKKSSSAPKDRKSASRSDKKERHKSSKLHHKISSSSSNTISSSSESESEKEKHRHHKPKRQDHKHKSSHKHSKPQASVSGKINNVTPSKSAKNTSPVEDLYSTDTSISSHISSAYERSMTEMRIATQRQNEERKSKPKSKKSNKLEPLNNGVSSAKDRHMDSPKKEKLSSRQSSLDPPNITFSDIPVEKTPEKKVKKKKKSTIPDEKPSKKNSSPAKKEKKETKRDVSSPIQTKSRREATPSPPLRSYASPLPPPAPKESPSPSKSDRFIESVIIPQIAEMVHASAELHERSDDEELSGVSSIEESSDEEENPVGAQQTEDEKVEFSLKDTKKQVTGGTGYPMKLLMNSYSLCNGGDEYPTDSDKDDPYMAGFRAGMSATKGRTKNPEEEEKEKKLKNGPTIHQACEDGDLDRMKELIEAIPDLKEKFDERGWAPIHISAAYGHLDLLKWLSISGVNLSEETRTGYTPIHLAAMNGHVNCIMILSAMGCSISVRTVDQFTPLHLAAMSGHVECLKWLLSNRARIDAKDENGRTPLDLAEEYGHEECERLLSIMGSELKRKDSAMSILSNPYALRKNSSAFAGSLPTPERSDEEEEEEKNWLSDAEETSEVKGRGGDERQESQRRQSVVAGRRNSSAKRGSVSGLPPKPSARRMSKAEERQSQQLEEKKKNYIEQRKKIERRNSSFLDSIRADIDGVEDDF